MLDTFAAWSCARWKPHGQTQIKHAHEQQFLENTVKHFQTFFLYFLVLTLEFHVSPMWDQSHNNYYIIGQTRWCWIQVRILYSNIMRLVCCTIQIIVSTFLRVITYCQKLKRTHVAKKARSSVVIRYSMSQGRLITPGPYSSTICLLEYFDSMNYTCRFLN